MSILRTGGTNYIGVRDIPAATAWYIEKLGLRKMTGEVEECPECIALGLNKEEYALTLGPPQNQTEELTPILFTGVIGKAHEFLSARCVRVSEIRQDRQGTRYFEMQDLEGNVIEITEEP